MRPITPRVVRRQLEFFPLSLHICDPLPHNKKGYKVTGADMSDRQNGEGQSLCPPLDSHITTGRNFSTFGDTGLIQIPHSTASRVLSDCAVYQKAVKSSLFRENGAHVDIIGMRVATEARCRDWLSPRGRGRTDCFPRVSHGTDRG